ncbi:MULTISPECIES: UPF0149 family protein [Thiomicrorhabdus]|uniref:UPF0149 family protein n=1 Tax=Thiomicrorhabdus heinhorstiae TaxID=2748010 RepID=A0ABS0BZ07_9GAMM|nr:MULTISPECIES: UPF0149 family protein [Thiomicrorhabdus]MBF6058280.1 UPF0149 family protein [Thiomicrorhabdus heinhorstiae]
MEFDRVNEVISAFPELESPSFIQGILIGLLCADNDIKETVWIKRLIEEAEIKSVKESFLQVLHELYLQTNKGLNGSGFELQLCLPDDETDLATRAFMLGQLCEGVLYGLGLVSHLSDFEARLSHEVRDALSDLGEIARIDIDGLNDETSADDVSENDLMQLVEYVKVSLLMVNEELNPTQAAPIMENTPPNTQIH